MPERFDAALRNSLPSVNLVADFLEAQGCEILFVDGWRKGPLPSVGDIRCRLPDGEEVIFEVKRRPGKFWTCPAAFPFDTIIVDEDRKMFDGESVPKDVRTAATVVMDDPMEHWIWFDWEVYPKDWPGWIFDWSRDSRKGPQHQRLNRLVRRDQPGLIWGTVKHTRYGEVSETSDQVTEWPLPGRWRVLLYGGRVDAREPHDPPYQPNED